MFAQILLFWMAGTVCCGGFARDSCRFLGNYLYFSVH